MILLSHGVQHGVQHGADDVWVVLLCCQVQHPSPLHQGHRFQQLGLTFNLLLQQVRVPCRGCLQEGRRVLGQGVPHLCWSAADVAPWGRTGVSGRLHQAKCVVRVEQTRLIASAQTS